MTETPSQHQPHRVMQLLQLLTLFSMAILLSGLATNYVFHRVRLLAGDGVSCTRYLSSGAVERLYGATQCDRN